MSASGHSLEVTSVLRPGVVYAPLVRVICLRQEVWDPAAAAVLRPAVRAAVPAACGRPEPAGHAPHDALQYSMAQTQNISTALYKLRGMRPGKCKSTAQPFRTAASDVLC